MDWSPVHHLLVKTVSDLKCCSYFNAEKLHVVSVGVVEEDAARDYVPSGA